MRCHLIRAVVLALLSAAMVSSALAIDNKPNIITVFIDDMGWSDLSCFNGDHVVTEHIDRLASEGIKFTNFYVNSPICSPSRVALTTGQYPQRWRITSYLNNRRSNIQRGMAQWLDPKAPVLARELQKNGYATGHFGKWHMGGQRDVDDAPEIAAYGFDRSLTNFEGMGPKLLPLTLKPGQDPAQPGRIWQNAVRLGEGVTWMQRSHITKGFVDAALAFIDESQESGKPFFVNVWPDDVHSPFFPPLDKWGNGKRELYYGVLDAMDEQLGLLFKRVRDDARLRENTLILIASDNGHETGAGKSDPLRGAKTWLYEGGIRSPLIVWGPGLLAKKSVGQSDDSSILCALDVNRSLYSLTGTDLPEGATLDGEDLSATLLGREEKSRAAPIYWRRPPDRPGFGHGLNEDNPDLAVRDGKWKFLVNYDGSDPQLYHLGKDPGEEQNVAGNFPRVVEDLRGKLEKWNSTLPQDAGNPRAAEPVVPTSKFVNPIGEGADPWVVRDVANDRYLWCFSEGNRGIAIHSSGNLSTFGKKHVVWNAPKEGPYSKEVWAPELHFLDGRWHIYFAASDGRNENHLTYVLRARSDDPLGKYELHGPLATGDGQDGKSPNVWAIDMTPLEHEGKLYALWSGWDAPGTDRQFLYIAPMKSPTELAGPRVRLCPNDDYPWEFTEGDRKGRGLNEGPQVLQSGKRTCVIFSCGASWLPTYKLGMLELVGDDPLDPQSWKKHETPVFTGTEETYGAGHSCFTKSPDGSEWWHVFHAKRDRNPGWRRAVFVQPMHFKDDFPVFGDPVAPGSVRDRPRGELIHPMPISTTYSIPAADGLWPFEDWSYFGHHQLVRDTLGVTLGQLPEHPVNLYRSGEKLVLNRAAPRDLEVEVFIRFEREDSRDAGILLRTSGPSVGYDAQRGYFVGLIPRTNLVVFGRMDGRNWTELARAETQIDVDVIQGLSVTAAGDTFTIYHGESKKMTVTDATYREGAVGLRVVDAEAEFIEFHLEAINEKKRSEEGPRALELGPRLELKAGEQARTPSLSDAGAKEERKTVMRFGGDWQAMDNVLSVSGADDGPRVLWTEPHLADFELEVEIMVDDKSQAGIVFRVDRAGTGVDAYRGYYVGIHGQKQRVMWGTALPGWKEIAHRNTAVTPDHWHRLRVIAHGENVKVFLDDKEQTRYALIDGIDQRLRSGLLGFRALGNRASFRNLKIRGYSPPPATSTYTNPVQSRCADPAVFKANGIYYAYTTHSADFPNMPKGIRGYSSPDLVHWQDLGYVLKKENSWGEDQFWAPDLVEKNGTYYLYYAADTRICVATAKRPEGPFVQEVKEPMEPGSIRIDAHVFEDDDGQNYFYYVKFNQGNEIWGGLLNEDMTSVDEGSLKLMIKPDQPWEQQMARIAEGAEVIKHKGVYYLTYSGSHFQSPDYAVGYATSDHPLGPWKKYEFNPIMKSTSYAHGTAHHCLTTSPDGKEHFIVYHRHNSLSRTEPRSLSIDRIQFVPQDHGPDVLEVWGPTSSAQPLPSGAGEAVGATSAH